MVRRIVSCNDLVYEELKEAYDVVKDYLCEALGRFGVESFAMFGTFYFIDDITPKTNFLNFLSNSYMRYTFSNVVPSLYVPSSCLNGKKYAVSL